MNPATRINTPNLMNSLSATAVAFTLIAAATATASDAEQFASMISSRTEQTDGILASRPIVHVASTRQINAADSQQHLSRQDRQLRELHRPLSEIRITRLPGGTDAPANQAADLVDEPARQVTALGAPDDCGDRSTTNIYYQPLYFEQPNLERCNRHLGVLQNIISLSQFTGRTLTLPYAMGRHLPAAKVIAGSDCRTGNYYQTTQSYRPVNTGRMKDRPSTTRGLAVQAGALAGFTFLLL